MTTCPSCGDWTSRLIEGFCPHCSQERQDALDEHNARQDQWDAMTEAERDAAIRRAIR